MTPTRKEIVKLLREAARIPLDDYAAGAEQIKRFRRAADALEAAEPKGTRLASARGKLGDLFVEAGEAGLDKSGTEDFVREGFGEWVERTLAETLTAAPVLTFEERVERAAAALWKIRAADLCEDLLLEEKPPWTDAPPMMAKLIRYQTIVVLRAAAVE